MVDRDWMNISYLNQGSEIQRKVYDVVVRSGVMEELAEFDPVLTGTYPIGLNIPGSDLDVICSYSDASAFADFIQMKFKDQEGFSMTRKLIRDEESIIARFYYEGFKLEIFGQALPVTEQYAYRHMLIENKILKEKDPSFRQKIISLKRKGLSTEEAFANILGIKGDPYEELLKLEL